MLGNILRGLTDAAAASERLAAIADGALVERVKRAAEENCVTPGTYVAATVRHLLDHASEEIWLDLVARMANSPQPGAAAVQAILALAFPAPRDRSPGEQVDPDAARHSSRDGQQAQGQQHAVQPFDAPIGRLRRHGGPAEEDSFQE